MNQFMDQKKKKEEKMTFSIIIETSKSFYFTHNKIYIKFINKQKSYHIYISVRFLEFIHSATKKSMSTIQSGGGGIKKKIKQNEGFYQ